MKIELVSRLPADAPVVVIASYEGRRLTQSAAALDRQLGGRVRKAMAGGRFTGALGHSLDIVAPAGFTGHRVILVGLGKAGSLSTLGAQDVGGDCVADGKDAATIDRAAEKFFGSPAS